MKSNTTKKQEVVKLLDKAIDRCETLKTAVSRDKIQLIQLQELCINHCGKLKQVIDKLLANKLGEAVKILDQTTKAMDLVIREQIKGIRQTPANKQGA